MQWILLISMAWAGLTAPTTVSTQPTSNLTVNVLDIDTDEEGKIRITLFNKEDGFPNDYETGYRTQTVAITGKSVQVKFTDLPYGTYAVAVLHDEDGDKVMDYNWVGIPTEGWVVSNEVFPALRSPYFSEASFELNSASKTLNLHIDY